MPLRIKYVDAQWLPVRRTMSCRVCKSDDHYPIQCPDLPIPCRCGAISTLKVAFDSGWESPRKGEGSKFLCPICVEKRTNEN